MHNQRPTIKILLQLLVKHWYWFVISMIAFGVYGYLTSKKVEPAKHKYYSRAYIPEVIFNESKESSLPPLLKPSFFTREEVMTVAGSSEMIMNSVRSCNYQVDYYQSQRGKGLVDIFDKMPISVYFRSLSPEDVVSVNAEVMNDRLIINEVNGTFKDNKIVLDNPLEVPYNNEVSTPMGSLYVEALCSSPADVMTERTQGTKVVICRGDEDASVLYLEKNLEIFFEHGYAMRMNLISDESKRKCQMILNTLPKEINKMLIEYADEKLLYQEKILLRSQDSIAYLTAGLKDVAANAQRLNSHITQELIETRRMRLDLRGATIIKTLDWARQYPAKDASGHLPIVMLMIGVLIPLPFIYLHWLLRGKVNAIENLPTTAQKRVKGITSMRKDPQAMAHQWAKIMHSSERVIAISPMNQTDWGEATVQMLAQAANETQVKSIIISRVSMANSPYALCHSTNWDVKGSIRTQISHQLASIDGACEKVLILLPMGTTMEQLLTIGDQVDQMIVQIQKNQHRISDIEHWERIMAMEEVTVQDRVSYYWIES